MATPEASTITEPTPATEVQEYLARPEIFDWSDKRKAQVIDGSKVSLNEILISCQDLDTDDRIHITDLWDNVIQAFQHGGDITVRGKPICKVKPNQLSAHSEYHIAKVLTIASKLLQANATHPVSTENKLALALGVILHDIGILSEVQLMGTTPAQTALYEAHELHAMSKIDEIIDSLMLQTNTVGTARLKAKVKILTAATAVPMDMIFTDPTLDNIPIIKILRETKDGPTSASFMSNLYITKLISEIQKAIPYLDVDDSEAFINIIKIMTSADHGSYLLEPCRIGEIISLWQELMTYFRDGRTLQFRHRLLPPGTKNYQQYVLSDFPRAQRKIYGEMLKGISDNPFIAGVSVASTLDGIDTLNSTLMAKAEYDPLLRLEGFFSPKQLWDILQSFDFRPNEITALYEAFHAYNQLFSKPLREQRDFNALATNVIRTLIHCICNTYEGDERQKHIASVFVQALKTIHDQVTGELQSGKNYNLHISPCAYIINDTFTLDDVFTGINDALTALDAHERPDSVTFAHRTIGNKSDDLDALITHINTLKSTDGMPKLGISLSGTPVSAERLKTQLNSIDQAGIAVTVHIGLEQVYESMKERVQQILTLDTQQLTIHIDHQFEWINKIYEELDDLQKQKFLSLRFTYNPLGYMLTGGRQAYIHVQKFYRMFPLDYKPRSASHNSCQIADLGISAQGAAVALMAREVNAPSQSEWPSIT